MFDVAPSEFLLVAVLALIVIGPKDMPRVMRTVGRWVGKARSVAQQFRSGFDEMLRESELREMEQKWRAENERIMRDHPAAVQATDETAGSTAPASAPSNEDKTAPKLSTGQQELPLP